MDRFIAKAKQEVHLKVEYLKSNMDRFIDLHQAEVEIFC